MENTTSRELKEVTEKSPEGYGRTIQQLISIFVEPEIRRRQEAADAPTPFELRSFQIILFSDSRPTQVRLNEDVQAVAEALIKPGVKKEKGDPIYLHEIEGFERLRKPEDDEPDAAHATVVRVGDRWVFSFDFRYNKARAAELLDVAREFLETARDALKADRSRASVDCLFSAAELTAYADLLLLPLRGLSEKASHRGISTKVNEFSVHGRIPAAFRDTFNKLSSLRTDLRYLKRDVTLEEDVAVELLNVVSERIKEVRASLREEPHERAG